MISKTFMSLKSTLKVILISVVALGIFICGFFSYRVIKKAQKYLHFNNENTYSTEEKEGLASNASVFSRSQLTAEVIKQKSLIASLNQALSEQSAILLKEKKEREKAISDIYGTKKIVLKDANLYSILLSLIALENKIHTGGSIQPEIVKIKIFSNDIPPLQNIISQISNIKELASPIDIQKEFNEYVKNVKSISLENQQSKLSKFLSVAARYFTILNKHNTTDEILLEAGADIKNERFEKAYEGLKSIDLQNDRTQKFLQNIEQTAKTQTSVSEMYAFITSLVLEK